MFAFLVRWFETTTPGVASPPCSVRHRRNEVRIASFGLADEIDMLSAFVARAATVPARGLAVPCSVFTAQETPPHAARLVPSPNPIRAWGHTVGDHETCVSRVTPGGSGVPPAAAGMSSYGRQHSVGRPLRQRTRAVSWLTLFPGVWCCFYHAMRRWQVRLVLRCVGFWRSQLADVTRSTSARVALAVALGT